MHICLIPVAFRYATTQQNQIKFHHLASVAQLFISQAPFTISGASRQYSMFAYACLCVKKARLQSWESYHFSCHQSTRHSCCQLADYINLDVRIRCMPHFHRQYAKSRSDCCSYFVCVWWGVCGTTWFFSAFGRFYFTIYFPIFRRPNPLVFIFFLEFK